MSYKIILITQLSTACLMKLIRLCWLSLSSLWLARVKVGHVYVCNLACSCKTLCDPVTNQFVALRWVSVFNSKEPIWCFYGFFCFFYGVQLLGWCQHTGLTDCCVMWQSVWLANTHVYKILTHPSSRLCLMLPWPVITSWTWRFHYCCCLSLVVISLIYYYDEYHFTLQGDCKIR